MTSSTALTVTAAPALTTGAATMSSREIAELTGKEHRNVMRDISNMFDQLEGVLTSEQTPVSEYDYMDSEVNQQNGQRYSFFRLPKDLTITLVSGYSIPMRHKIVTRWMELEAVQARPVVMALSGTNYGKGRMK